MNQYCDRSAATARNARLYWSLVYITASCPDSRACVRTLNHRIMPTLIVKQRFPDEAPAYFHEWIAPRTCC